MNAKLIFIIGVIITIVLLVSAITLGSGSGPFLPYDGDETGDPDSGDDTPPDEEVTLAIKITAPSNPYSVPETGNSYGGYCGLMVQGQIYGLNAVDVKKVKISWRDHAYGWPNMYADLNPHDDYNIYFEGYAWYDLLGSGSHMLIAKGLNSAGVTVCSATLEVVIPSYWKYHWDSRSPVRSDSVYHSVQYFYGFTFPYEVDTFFSSDGWNYLMGKLDRVEGQVQVDHTGTTCPSSGCTVHPCIWDGTAGSWIDYTHFSAIPTPSVGWSQDFNANLRDYWGNELGFVGATGTRIDGFVGDLYIIPGTVSKISNPLSIIFNLFNTDSQNDPPHP